MGFSIPKNGSFCEKAKCFSLLEDEYRAVNSTKRNRPRFATSSLMDKIQPSIFLSLVLRLYLSVHKFVFGKGQLKLGHHPYYSTKRTARQV